MGESPSFAPTAKSKTFKDSVTQTLRANGYKINWSQYIYSKLKKL